MAPGAGPYAPRSTSTKKKSALFLVFALSSLGAVKKSFVAREKGTESEGLVSVLGVLISSLCQDWHLSVKVTLMRSV